MNILYIGSSGALSLMPFEKLLSLQHSVVAVGVDNPILIKDKIIALENSSLSLLANQKHIPVVDLSKSPSSIIEQCSRLSVDLILMSCYGRRLPDEVIRIAEADCFNMHPSLLPKYRGPEPIFWQMKDGTEVGVSWHFVSKDFDAGDVVKQKSIYLHDGECYEEINKELAVVGSNLMESLLNDVIAGAVSRNPQDPGTSSYYAYPAAQDFVIDVTGSAQQAFNFMKATQEFGHSYLCRLGDHSYLLDKALDFDNNGYLQHAEISGNTLNIPCNEGVLTATFTGKL